MLQKLPFRPVRSFLLALLALIGLSACGGPSGKELLAKAEPAKQQFLTSLAASDWAAAAVAIESYRHQLNPHQTVKVDGSTIGACLDTFRVEAGAAITQQRLVWSAQAQTSRATLEAVNSLLRLAGEPAVVNDWFAKGAVAAEVAVSAKEAAAREAITKAEAARMAGSYLVWSRAQEKASNAPSEQAVAYAKALSARFAPVMFIAVREEPAADVMCVGTVMVREYMAFTEYGGNQMGLGGTQVPHTMNAQVTIRNRGGVEALDGDHVFAAEITLPESVSQHQLYSLRRRKTEELRALMERQIAQWDTSVTGNGLAEAIAASNAGAPLPLWTWTVRSSTTVVGAQHLRGYDWKPLGEPIAAAVRQSLGKVRMLPEAGVTGQHVKGTITITLSVVETTFGRSMGAHVRTENDSMPVALTAFITVTPTAGKPSWGQPARSFKAEVAAPNEVNLGDVQSQIMAQSRKLVEGVKQQIAAAGPLTIQP